MKLNFAPSKVAFLDFETQSECDLNTVHQYATHKSTRALTCVVEDSDGVVHRMGPYLNDEDKRKLLSIAETHTIVAHNAPFDAAIWELTLGLPEVEWFDTLPCARAGGYPGKLDDISKIVTGRGKDPNGKRLIDMCCIIKQGKVPHKDSPAYKLLMEYNVRDVEELKAIYHVVKGYGEPEVMQVDRIINDRGVPIDVQFAKQLQTLYAESSKIAEAKFQEVTGGVLATSPKQVKEWLKQRGFEVPGTGKSIMKDLLDRPEEFFVGDDTNDELAAEFAVVKEAIEQKREIVRVGASKVDAMLETVEADGRIREQFVVYGAGPGRWAGRRAQFHNFPLAPKYIDARKISPTMESIVEAADLATIASEADGGNRIAVADVLNAMVRHVVKAPNLNIADYGSVELRGTAKIAKCEKMLHLLSDPKASVYCDMGRAVYGRPITKDDKAEYALSKALVLGSTYGMSGAKFDQLCKTRNVSVATLRAMGLTAAETVKLFRQTYPEIPALWRLLGTIVMDVVRYRQSFEDIACCDIYMDGPNMVIKLPSGRRINYRNARIGLKVPSWQKLLGVAEVPIETVLYDTPRGGEGFLYGSKICENIVQGMCRDFLAHALVCFEQEGMRPCLHVHDEAVCEDDPKNFMKFMEIMSTPPSWAPDFPLLVEGYRGPMWTKRADGYEEAHFLSGKCVKHKHAV